MTTLSAFIGQPRLLERLTVLVEADLLGGARLPHLLFSGPAGTGKATLAAALADDLRVPFTTLSMPVPTHELTAALAGTGVLLVTDLHLTPRAAQPRLATFLTTGDIGVPVGRDAGNPGLTVIATTTQGQLVDAALAGGFFSPRWEPYSPADLLAITTGLVEEAALPFDAETIAALAGAAGGNPGQAARLVRTAVTLGVWNDALPTLAEVLTQAGSDPDGMTEAHLGYLDALDLLEGGGSARLVSLTTRLHPTVCEDLERLLLALGLIRFCGLRREITIDGRRRVEAHYERGAAA